MSDIVRNQVEKVKRLCGRVGLSQKSVCDNECCINTCKGCACVCVCVCVGGWYVREYMMLWRGGCWCEFRGFFSET